MSVPRFTLVRRYRDSVQISPKQHGPPPGGPLLPVVSDVTATHSWPDAALPEVTSFQVVPESADVQTDCDARIAPR